MCLDKEHQPHKKEVARYYFGYKVVVEEGSTFYPQFHKGMAYTAYNRYIGRWFQAEGSVMYPKDYGFYVYVHKEDAQAAAKLMNEVVMKVYISGILAVGRKDGKVCVRCKQMKFAM